MYWSRGKRTFEVALGPVSEDQAEICRLEIQLALRTGNWPDWAADSPAVARYKSAALRSGPILPSSFLDVYEPELRSEVSASWAGTSLAALRELREFTGKELHLVNAADAQAFLVHVMNSRGPWLKGRRQTRTRATRNRVRAACSRFYRWAIATGRLQSNPFSATQLLDEGDRGDIVHLDRRERDAVLEAASCESDGVAVWLALYAGLRLGEIIRCDWRDVDVANRKLSVPRTKTGRRRVIDLASALRTKLKAMAKPAGPVVEWADGTLTPKHSAELLLRRIEARLPRVERRLGWNVFRHTFASLLVQAGVSIFKVASWLGNDPRVCERHYAAMKPGFDADIDRG